MPGIEINFKQNKSKPPMPTEQSAMQLLKQWVDDNYPKFNKADIEEKIKELLEVERKQIIDTWQDGYANGCSVGGNDYTTETKEDTGEFYYNKTYNQ